MNWEIIDAAMTRDPESGFLGKVTFKLEGHRSVYEITLHSEDGEDWSYSLIFAEESGSEEEIEKAEELIESDDDLFDALVEAAQSKL